MRPLQLSFSGIRSYPGPVGPLDLTGKRLIAIVGDTGAGKSTVLEAISLALYGNCTWASGEHRELMAEGAVQMTVDLTFAHDGERWRVRRVYHANTTPSSHLLENLDTHEQTDGKRAVDAKIVALLQLSFGSFASAVLLPQGKFDRLLTASGTERTVLLRSIFGVQVIETVRDRAAQHREQLTGLLHRAELARRDLLADPAGTAVLEAAKAAEATRIADELGLALGTLRTLRAEASASRRRHTAISDALDKLEQRETRDAAAELAGISAADTELAGLEASAAQAQAQWAVQRGAADGQLAAASLEGFTPESLASAATVLDALPGRVAALLEEHGQLNADEAGLSCEAGQLAEMRARLVGLQSAAGTLAKAHADASAEHQEYRDARRSAEEAARTAMHRAAGAGKAQREEEAALSQASDFASSITGFETAANAAAAEVQSAEDHLARVLSQDAAHAAGAHLAPGEPCPVCVRPLPAGYQPPAPSDAEALSAAQLSVNNMKKAHGQARDQLAAARAKADSAQRAHAARQSDTQAARNRLEQARKAAVDRMQALEQRKPSAQASSAGEPAFEQALDTACIRLAGTAEEEQDELLGRLLAQLLSAAAEAERQFNSAAMLAGEKAGEAKAEAGAEAHAISVRQESHQKKLAAVPSARERHRNTLDVTAQELTALPAALRQMLPGEVLCITSEHARQARHAVTVQQEKVAELSRLRNQAIGELEDLSATLRRLEQRRRREVSGPLHSIAIYLQRWQDAVEEAVRACHGNSSVISVPARSAAGSVDAITSYAGALAQADKAVIASLSQAAEAAAGDAGTQLVKLHRAAGRLKAGKSGLPVIALPEGDGLLEPSSLDALVSGQTTARDDASRHRKNQATAEGQVQQAASLDAALRDGKARLSAVETLRGLLADGKFLRYLTDRRTRALLAVASEKFGTLSAGEFGFTEDFHVASRRSQAVRSPKTLSGGETFLASLALSLALVELHSRSGPRLGALFLDEGFASLDVDSLAGALAVLQAETGGDKLVAVISHLHAVAEAVEDVLWVERGPAGSAVRWLSADERDALVRQEATGGLLSLL
ncbi:SMC family ATPase [Trebonia kvetii]|uniref:Nuclease SbcCD subunit C n=1 Tax=Trebonia kvetii TaxID=2480626 RepID=A0A6P2C3I4_9ACTN|nr:SMC family ATPase [Trebonia kvetii]TVZ05036.1 SMC family ATPase [Trebonia kvetii]